MSMPCVALMLGLTWLGSAGPASAVRAEEAILSRPRFRVGFQVLDFGLRADGSATTITVAVWYPTAAAPAPHTYGGPTTGMVAVGAEPLAGAGPCPLLVFSHGYGGTGLGAVFLAERLAARGWIVAAPDHHDSHSAARIRTGGSTPFDRRGLLMDARAISESGVADRTNYLYRIDELRCAIEGVLGCERFGGMLDPARMALGGHSFGGFTALGLCGTMPDRLDPRIRAVLLFSTGAGGYLYTDEELARVSIPAMVFVGERERGRRRGDATMSELAGKVYRSMRPPKYFIEVRDANHFSFNNGFSTRFGARWTRGTEDQFRVIGDYSAAFLERHAAGRLEKDSALDRQDPMLTVFLKDLGPGAAAADGPCE